MVKRKKTKGQTMIYETLSLLITSAIDILVNYGRLFVSNTTFNWFSKLWLRVYPKTVFLETCRAHLLWYLRFFSRIFQLYRQIYKLINEGKCWISDRKTSDGCLQV